MNIVAKEMLKSLVILLVEDDDEVQYELSCFLKKRVGTLYIASNGLVGLESYKKNKPDVVVTDIKMPVMNGLEMAKGIREINQDVPIILITAFTKQESLLNSIDIKIDKYVHKPINPFLLLDVFLECTNRQNNHKEAE